VTRYIVTLTEEQRQRALAGGRERMRYATRYSMKPEEDTARAGRDYDRHEADHMLGALGEVAYAVWQGLPWRWDSAVAKRGEKKLPDFCGDRDVKTIYAGGRYLLLQKRDPDDRIYILARGTIESCDVQFLGWCMGEEAKIPAHWREGERPCYWTDADDLHSMPTLPGIKLTEDSPIAASVPTYLAAGANCGSLDCGGCYSVGDGKMIHPPRAGWKQSDLKDRKP